MVGGGVGAEEGGGCPMICLDEGRMEDEEEEVVCVCAKPRGSTCADDTPKEKRKKVHHQLDECNAIDGRHSNE